MGHSNRRQLMKPPRVLIAGLFHETHTFLDGSTGLADFSVLRGDAMLACSGDSSPLGGVLDFGNQQGWQWLPAVDYRAQPSAIVEDSAFEAFWQDCRSEAEASCKDQAPDAIYLILHGAMASRSILDIEGEFLRRLRALPLFAQAPIFGVFDLHANLSQEMISFCDHLVGYRENPHSDARDAAILSARMLDRHLRGEPRPLQRLKTLPIIWPPTGTASADEPMRQLNLMARQMEQRPGLWTLSIVPGFAFADTPDTGLSLLATGSDASAMQACLEELAAYAQAHREQGNRVDPPLESVAELLRRPPPGLSVLVEPSDNIGGGAPGDGTGLLRAMLQADTPNAAICLCDPAAVAAAMKAGEGSHLCLGLGGKGSRLDAGPVELEVQVLSLKPGRFKLEDPNSHLASMCGDHFDMGPCALLQHRGITLLVTSIKTPPFDLGQWRSQGVEPREKSIIVVKAAVAHRRVYDPIAARMLWVDSPGPCRSRLNELPFRHRRRPCYPLDAEA